MGLTSPLRGAWLPVALYWACVATAAAQTPQYTSPAGVTYRSLRDTGTVARAESVLARDPRNVSRMLELGLAQSGAQQYREAIGTFTRAIAIAPGDALLYRYRGHRYISLRLLDSAVADLERGAWLDSTNYDIWYHIGVARHLRGEFGRAADAFQRALALAPNDNEKAGSADWLWMSAMRAGRRDVARATLAQLRDTMQITSATAYWRRLQLYRGRLRPEQLVTAADTAGIQLATLLYGVGNWYLVNRDTAHAREYFRRAVASGGWAAFGFIAAEAELRRLR
jgi:tetratricopeptide (TPR) repeat protein